MSSSGMALLGDIQLSTPSFTRHHTPPPSTRRSDQPDHGAPTECYACTQAGAPVFHSTSCDHANPPEWAANAGSSLIPIQPGSTPPGSTKPLAWLFGPVLDPREPHVHRLNRVFLLARAVALAVDPLFFYTVSVGLSAEPCVSLDAELAVALIAVRTCVDVVHLWHVWFQLKMAYVSRESLVIGCGKLVWDPRLIAQHYARSATGFWLDVFVILPIPQVILNFIIYYLLELFPHIILYY